MKRLSPQDLPLGIETTGSTREDGSRVYTFTHRRLGVLGNFVVKAHGAIQTEISVEVAPGDPDAPGWDERFRLLNQCVTICADALPGERNGQPLLPPVEEVRVGKRLFRRFIETAHSIEMFALAKSLSDEEYQKLLEMIGAALKTADRSDAHGIRQRREELQTYWEDLKERPIV
jgi:hypothetical protein